MKVALVSFKLARAFDQLSLLTPIPEKISSLSCTLMRSVALLYASAGLVYAENRLLNFSAFEFFIAVLCRAGGLAAAHASPSKYRRALPTSKFDSAALSQPFLSYM